MEVGAILKSTSDGESREMDFTIKEYRPAHYVKSLTVRSLVLLPRQKPNSARPLRQVSESRHV
jgi:hypothetical protein